jgi:hypothetical protein
MYRKSLTSVKSGFRVRSAGCPAIRLRSRTTHPASWSGVLARASSTRSHIEAISGNRVRVEWVERPAARRTSLTRKERPARAHRDVEQLPDRRAVAARRSTTEGGLGPGIRISGLTAPNRAGVSPAVPCGPRASLPEYECGVDWSPWPPTATARPWESVLKIFSGGRRRGLPTQSTPSTPFTRRYRPRLGGADRGRNRRSGLAIRNTCCRLMPAGRARAPL